MLGISTEPPIPVVDVNRQGARLQYAPYCREATVPSELETGWILESTLPFRTKTQSFWYILPSSLATDNNIGSSFLSTNDLLSGFSTQHLAI